MRAQGMCARVVALAVVMAAARGEVLAQTASVGAGVRVDPVNGLTLRQAVRRALDDTPVVAASRMEAEAALHEREQAERRANPRVAVSREQQAGGADSVLVVDAMWDLELSRRQTRIGVAERASAVAVAGTMEVRRQVALDVANAYGDLLSALAELDVANQLVATFEQTLALAAARVENGAAPALDRNIAAVELLRARAARFPREAAAQSARVNLNRAMGIAPATDVRVKAELGDALVVLWAETDVALARRRAIANRADLQVARAEVLQATALVAAARSEGTAEYAVSAGYARTRAGFPLDGLVRSGGTAPIEDVFHGVSFGLSIGLPLFNRNQGGVAAARAFEARAESLEAARALAAEAEVVSAEIAAVGARRAAEVFSEELTDLARRNVEVVRESYVLGAATLTDVLQEQRRYLEVMEARASALAQAHAASTALLGALGELP